MSEANDYDCFDEEMMEFLQNYHSTEETGPVFCTKENFKECLIGLLEELKLLHIDNVFNPYCDLVGQTLEPEALVKFINSFWMLLQLHKSTAQKAANLVEENQEKDYLIKRLSDAVDKLKDELNKEKNQNKKSFATVQEILNHFKSAEEKIDMYAAHLKKHMKENDDIQKTLLIEYRRMKDENERVTEMHNSIISKTVKPCSEICQSTISQLKHKETQHLAMIANLQQKNAMLLKALMEMKEK